MRLARGTREVFEDLFVIFLIALSSTVTLSQKHILIKLPELELIAADAGHRNAQQLLKSACPQSYTQRE